MQADIRDVTIERYFPDVLANASEFKAIADAVNPELVASWKEIWKQFINTFVLDADLDGIRRWESMLKIVPLVSYTIEDRRQNILAVINATLPYTERRLKQILDGLCGAGTYKIEVDCIGEMLVCYMYEAGNKAIDRVHPFLRNIIPANLGLTIGLFIEMSMADAMEVLAMMKVNINLVMWNRPVGSDVLWNGEYDFDGEVDHSGYRLADNWDDISNLHCGCSTTVNIVLSGKVAANTMNGTWVLDGTRNMGEGTLKDMAHNQIMCASVINGIQQKGEVI